MHLALVAEAAVKLLKLPLRHPGLAKLPSLDAAAAGALSLLAFLLENVDGARAFRVRCVDAGLVPPLLHFLEAELADPGERPQVARIYPSTFPPSNLVIGLCLNVIEDGSRFKFGATIPANVTAFVNGGIAPILVMSLQLPEGCVLTFPPSPPNMVIPLKLGF